LDTFKSEIDEFASYLKSTKTQVGVDEVFYPGELEHIREIERLRDGCVIEDTTWAKLKEVAEKYNVASELSFD
jgi:uncharacterized oxidoreductase